MLIKNLRAPARMAFALAGVLAGGCHNGEVEVETIRAPLTQAPQVVNVGFGYQRAIHKVCGQKCIDGYEDPYNEYNGGYQCNRWVLDCDPSTPPQEVTLRENTMEAAPMGAFKEGDNYIYKGCGPKMVQNVLNYFGAPLPIKTVAFGVQTFNDQVNFGITTWKRSDNIATWPDHMRRDLSTLLNEWGDGTFTAKRESGVDVFFTAYKELLKGNPIIVLAENGEHYYFVTGARCDFGAETLWGCSRKWLYVSDYDHNPGEWRDVDSLDTRLDFERRWIGDQTEMGWHSNTVITVARTPPASPRPLLEWLPPLADFLL